MPCYDFSGTPQQGDWVPCQLSTSDGLQPCCAGTDTCSSNKLCVGLTEICRGGCTDPTFSSDSCPKVCLYPYSVIIHDCGNSTGCCEYGANSNCSCQPGADGAISLGPNVVQVLTSSPSAGSTSTISTALTSTDPSSTFTSVATSQTIPSSDASPSADTKLGLEIGIPIGIIVGLCVMISAILFWIRRLLRNHGSAVEKRHREPRLAGTMEQYREPRELVGQEPSELSDTTTRKTRKSREIPGRTW